MSTDGFRPRADLTKPSGSISQFEHLPSSGSASVIPAMQAKIEELEVAVLSLQAALEREQRLSATYSKTIEYQNTSIVELRAHLDMYHLDPNEESQGLMDGPDSLRSTQELLDFMSSHTIANEECSHCLTLWNP